MTTRTDDQWRRTEFAILAAVFLFFAGSSFVMPFLPLYVIELDDFDTATAAIWSGLILGVTPLVSGMVAPVWGRLSDRVGQKILLQRSLAGFSVCLGLMAVAESSVQLLVIRALMGLVGGFSITAQAMISVGAPPGRVTGAIGRANAARMLGLAFGPIPGGLLADTVGIRGACVASVAGGFVGLAVVTVLVRAASPAPRPASDQAERYRVVTVPFATLIGLVTTLRAVERSFDPVIPLLIDSLEDKPLGTGMTTAIVSSGGLLATALGAALAGWLGGRDHAAQRMRLIACLLLSAGLVGATFFASTWWVLTLLRVLAGVVLGVALSVSTAQAALSVPVSRRGSAMGILGSGSAFGAAGGQIAAGLIAVVLLPAVFLMAMGLILASTFPYYLWGPQGRRPPQP